MRMSLFLQSGAATNEQLLAEVPPLDLDSVDQSADSLPSIDQSENSLDLERPADTLGQYIQVSKLISGTTHSRSSHFQWDSC